MDVHLGTGILFLLIISSFVVGRSTNEDSGHPSPCPEGFPYLERHTNNNHGDVCRKGKNVLTSHTCPVGCFGAGGTRPWCKASLSNNSPCRVHSENLRYVDDGCHSQGLDVVGKYQAESSKAFLRCCSDDGSSCDTLSDCQASSTLVNYADAVKECTANGMRLCTKDEILSDICCQTGGKCDSYGVWTSTLYTGNTTITLPTTTTSESPIQGDTTTALPTTTTSEPPIEGGNCCATVLLMNDKLRQLKKTIRQLNNTILQLNETNGRICKFAIDCTKPLAKVLCPDTCKDVGYSFGCYNDEIALKSHHGKYVTAEENGNAMADRRERRSWQKFVAKRVDENVFTFESAKHYTFLTAGNELEDFEIQANRYKASNWEKFEVVPQKEGKIALKTFHGKYVVADKEGNLKADRTKIGEWEKFTPECTSSD